MVRHLTRARGRGEGKGEGIAAHLLYVKAAVRCGHPRPYTQRCEKACTSRRKPPADPTYGGSSGSSGLEAPEMT